MTERKYKEKTQKRRNDKGKKSNREIEDLRWRESSEIGEKLISPRFSSGFMSLKRKLVREYQ